ncbi:MAG TPA: sigma-54 dependent transcriptional regulator [Bryobacteraceae bacterium]|jgi:DNA-binding NtrC family response regulator|nr:sigma-54 dependent transcriptional regulator [Bryobacteraceae bacterium]
MTSPEIHDFLGSPAVFASEAMLGLLALVRKVAVTNAVVLITGESGSGKEVIARAIHSCSLRNAASWVDVNCAALPENLLESELFGYEKGAFSGADSAKPGLFELAHRGTLFLDEIGDLDLRMQVKLLRVLDGAGYYRVGGVKKVNVDVRLVAATNRDLKASVEEQLFRSDLYHRLSQIRLLVPPLRERREDILPLAQAYLKQQAPALTFSSDVKRMLIDYSWPGNVRELRNVVVRAAVFASGREIVPADLPEEFSQSSFGADLHRLASLPDLERSAIVQALQESHGHQQKAATRLGISRRTLQRKIKSYRLTTERVVSIAG